MLIYHAAVCFQLWRGRGWPLRERGEGGGGICSRFQPTVSMHAVQYVYRYLLVPSKSPPKKNNNNKTTTNKKQNKKTTKNRKKERNKQKTTNTEHACCLVKALFTRCPTNSPLLPLPPPPYRHHCHYLHHTVVVRYSPRERDVQIPDSDSSPPTEFFIRGRQRWVMYLTRPDTCAIIGEFHGKRKTSESSVVK